MTRRRLALLLALLLALGPATPARAGGLTVTATRELVAWTGAPAGCVYWIGERGERWRLGCSYAPSFAPPTGALYPGDLVEVRRPTSTGVLTGRAIVQEE